MLKFSSLTTGLKLAALASGVVLFSAQLLAAEAEGRPANPPVVAAADVADKNAAPAPESVGQDDVDIILHGEPVKGYVVLPPSDTSFKFKHKETGVIMEFRWSELESSERKRVQKLYGMEVAPDGKKVFGDKLAGIRFFLESGKTWEGLAIPDSDRPGYKAIKTANAPLVMVPVSEIKSSETIERYESDFYSPQEVYERWLLEKPPANTDAAAHLETDRRTANIGLYNKAIDHLEQARIIDPRTEERNTDFRTQLVTLYAETQVQDLYSQMLRDVHASDFLSAKDRLMQLDRNFPNSTMKSRWDTLRPEIDVGVNAEINRSIVVMSYRIADDLLQKRLLTKVRVDAKGNLVPSIPGKQITTRYGHILKGILMGSGSNGDGPIDPYEVSEGVAKAPLPGPAGAGIGSPAAATYAPSTPDDIVLKQGDTMLTIAGKDIVSIMDVDLSVADKLVDPSYDELKEYVTDVSGKEGLKMEMLKKISQLVKMSEKKVKEIFDNRLNTEAKYEDGIMTKTNNFAFLHDVSYGKGSWLRDGSKPMAIQNKNNKQVAKYTTSRSGSTYTVSQVADPKEEENPDTTDDPLIWWKFQSSDVRLSTLRGMMAEKVFKATNVQKNRCPNCAGNGIIGVMLTGGNEGPQRCPDCRGIGVLFKITYH